MRAILFVVYVIYAVNIWAQESIECLETKSFQNKTTGKTIKVRQGFSIQLKSSYVIIKSYSSSKGSFVIPSTRLNKGKSSKPGYKFYSGQVITGGLAYNTKLHIPVRPSTLGNVNVEFSFINSEFYTEPVWRKIQGCKLIYTH